MLSKRVLYYGEDKAPPERIDLRAGPLTMLFEPQGVFLRYIRLGDREVLRGIYAAVRDLNWNTVTPQVSNVQVDKGDASFKVTFDVECLDPDLDLDFAWTGTITGQEDGTVAYDFQGLARSTFLRNRIGFCVLHSPDSAGAPARIEQVDGSVEEDVLPVHIAPQLIVDGLIKPHRPFHEMRALTHQVQDDLWARVHFEGEIFELEDQRNWTDASFKTYCTPLRLPFPVEVEEGTEVSQTITLSLEGQVPGQVRREEAQEVSFSVGRDSLPLPRIGLDMASHGQDLSDEEVARLRELNLSHLRVDLKLQEGGYAETLRRAAAEAGRLDLPLQAALHLSDNAGAELPALRELLDELQPQVRSWLIYHSEHLSTPEETLVAAQEHLADYDPDALFGAGSNAYFTEVNRDPPSSSMLQKLDLVCYSLNPQVHAFDNASMVETLAIQGETVESARAMLDDKPVAVSPVTLKPRFNPNATGEEPERPPDVLPPEVDPRQMSLFGACWTVGSVKYLSESGVASITYYETTGWRGVMETEEGAPLADKFPSLPGAVFPLYHVLADVGEFAGGEVVSSSSSHRLQVDGLVLRREETMRVLLANMTEEEQEVNVDGAGNVSEVRRLNETNGVEAMRSPEAFRRQVSEQEEATADTLRLTLKPYEVVCIDTAA